MELLRTVALAALASLLASCATSQGFDRLPPLRTAQSSELRINIAHYPSSARTAYAVTPGEIAIYEYRGRGWRSEILHTTVADDVLVAVADLQSLDGANLGCHVYDGDSVSIEASLSGERFSLHSANPDLCSMSGEDRATIRVNRVLNLIRALRGELILAPSP